MEQVKQDIIVTFQEYNYANYVPELDEEPKYLVVTFENAIGYQLGSGFIGVQGADGNFTIYPSELIRQVNINIKE